MLEKHDVIHWKVDDLSLLGNRPLIGHDVRLFHMIVLVLDKDVQSTADSIVLAGLDLDGLGNQGLFSETSIYRTVTTAASTLPTSTTIRPYSPYP